MKKILIIFVSLMMVFTSTLANTMSVKAEESDVEPIVETTEIGETEDLENQEISVETVEVSLLSEEEDSPGVVSQDADGNLVITPNLTADAFDEISLINIVAGDTTIELDPYAYTVDNGVITITRDMLLSEHIPSGNVDIVICFWSGRSDITLNCVNLSACQEIDENVYVTVNNDGIRIYSTDLDFLNALVRPTINDYSSDEPIEHQGSYLEFVDTTSYWQRIVRNNEDIYDRSRCLRNRYWKSNDETHVFIPTESLHDLNISKHYSELTIKAYGYLEKTYTVNLSSIGCEDRPDIITYSFDSDNNLIINSTDKNFLRGAVRPNVVYYDGTDEYFDGGEIIITYSNGDGYWIRNILSDGYLSNSYYYDEINEVVVLPYETLVSREIPAGNCYIHVLSYGYDNTENDDLTIPALLQNAPTDLSIYEDTDGNIVIETTDSAYLSALCSDELLANNDEKSNVLLMGTDSNQSYTNAYLYEEDVPILIHSGNTVTIANETLKLFSVANGDYWVRLSVFGYCRFDAPLTLTQASIEAPSSINVEVNSNNDIVITCPDSTFMNALLLDDSRVFVSSENGSFEYGFTSSQYYLEDSNTIVLPEEMLTVAEIYADTYRIEFYAYGYVYTYFSGLELDSYVTSAPEVSIYEQNGNLVIECLDADYMNALASFEINQYDGSFSEGGWIGFRSGMSLSNYRVIDPEGHAEDHVSYSYDSRNNRIVIPGEILLGNFIEKDNHIELNAPGYSTVSQDIYLSCGASNSLNTVNVPTVEYVAGTGIVITCDDEDFLDGIVEIRETHHAAFGLNLYNEEMNASGYFTNYISDGHPYYELNKVSNTVVVSEDAILKAILPTGEYQYVVMSYGYAYGLLSGTIAIQGCEQAPADLAVSYDPLGTIYFTSEDTDYLQAFENVNSKFVFTANGNDYLVFNDEISGVFTYENGRVRVNSQLLSTIVPEGSYEMILAVYGYSMLTTDVDVRYAESESVSIKLGTSLQLSFESDNETAWYSANPEIVSVDENGNILAKRVGTTTITAVDDLCGKTFEVKVKDLTTTDKLVVTVADSIVEVNDTTSVTVTLNGVEKNSEDFTFRSSNTNVATVDENGVVTALAKGTATITVSPIGSSKSTKCTLNVLKAQVARMDLELADNTATIADVDDSGVITEYLVSATENINAKLVMTVNSFDKNDLVVTDATYAYVSSDTGVAAIDTTGNVTIKKAGQVTLTATVKNNAAGNTISKTVIMRVVDYTPILETNKVTVNLYYEPGSDFNIYPVYGSEITNVSIDGDYAVTLNADGKSINIKYTGTEVKNNTSTRVLTVTLSNGLVYRFNLSVVLSNVRPGVKVTTKGTLNKFTGESTLTMSYVLNGKLEAEFNSLNPIEFVDNWASINSDGEVTIADPNINSGTVLFRFTDYSEPVTQTVKYSTVVKKPSYKADMNAVSLYIPDADAYTAKTVVMHIKDEKGNTLTPENGTISVDGALDSAVNFNANGDIAITINNPGLSGGKIMVSYHGNTWPVSSVLTYPLTVKVIKTVTMKAISFKLNSYFDYEKTELLPISSPTVGVADVEIVPSNATLDYTGVSLVYNRATGKLEASCGSNAKKASYPFSVTTTIEGGIKLNPVVIKVDVDNALPTVSLSATTVKLNSRFEETYVLKTKIGSNKFNACLEDVEITDSNAAIDINYNKVTGELTVSANERLSAALNGTYKYTLVPVFESDASGKAAGKPITLSVAVNNAVPKATVSVKGTLNQFDLSQRVTLTFKYANVTGKAIDCSISNSILNAVCEDNGNVTLSLASNAIIDQSIKADVTVTLDTGAVITAPVTVKVARVAPKVKLNPTTVNMYDATSRGALIASVNLEITGANGHIAQMWYSDSNFYRLELDEENSRINVYLIDAAGMKSGSTSKFTIKLDWEGDYDVYTLENKGKGLKSTSLTLSVKDACVVKGLVK